MLDGFQWGYMYTIDPAAELFRAEVTPLQDNSIGTYLYVAVDQHIWPL